MSNKMAPDLGKLDELAKVHALSYASPHHFTMSVNGLREVIAELQLPAGNKMALDALTAAKTQLEILLPDYGRVHDETEALAKIDAAIAALQAEPQFVPWVNVRGCGWHHYTPQNIDAMIRDLKAVEQGNEIPEWVNRDHRTRCGILWRVITALSHDVPLNPDPVMADDGLPPEPPPAPHLCIKPVCGPKCSDCNSAISDATMRRYAIRYAYLRDHDPRFGMPTAWLAFQTLDEAIDAALLATPPKD